jgi:cytoskeletal protein CcmA (bactofilin family)
MRKFKNPFSRKLTTDNFTNLIGIETVVRGDIFFNGVLKIEGVVNGNIEGNGPSTKSGFDECLIVDAIGLVESETIKAANVVIAGDVKAKKIVALGTLRVMNTATITGAEISYQNLEIEPGARLHDCHLLHNSCTETAISEPAA